MNHDYKNLTLSITFTSSYLLFINANNGYFYGGKQFVFFFKFLLILSNKDSVYVSVSIVRLGVGLIEKFASIYFFSTKKGSSK